MASIQASSLSVGTSVYLKYNENYEEFLVIHQGNPNSSIYDSSCNGTWLLKRNCFGTSESGYPYSSNSYNYSTSYMHSSYLNDVFNDLGNQEQNIIKQVKIPYCQDENIFLGSNGLSTQLFLLSITEIFGNVSNDYAATPDLGSQLKFFEDNVDTFILQDSDGVQLEIGIGCWTRTPQLTTDKNQVSVYANLGTGLFWGMVSYSSGGGYQPAMIISSDTLFDSSTMKLFTDDSNTSSNTTYKVGDALNYEYTGSMQSITLPAGTYKLECWGAQGGSFNTTYATGGLGGYSVGTITLTEKTTTLYLYVGGQGSYGSSTTLTTKTGGGFNGGGGASYRGGGGGGATDIRISQDSLYARVIVAGGGGGAYAYSTTYKAAGGAGGGTSGSAGSRYSTSYNYQGQGGTATAGGASNSGVTSGNYNGAAGSFGNGGASGRAYSSSYYSNGAGGGGWYGGSGADGYNSSARTRAAGGGGGSGYVYTSSTASNYPSGCLLNSSYYLTSASTTAGQRSGNGYITITVLELSTLPVSIKIDSSTWNEDIEMYVKIDSTTWKLVDSIYIKTENGWKEGG